MTFAGQAEEFRATRGAVANAKLNSFRSECWRLAILARRGVVQKQAAIDLLQEIAIAHALVRALGDDRVQTILNEAFANADFRPMRSEAREPQTQTTEQRPLCGCPEGNHGDAGLARNVAGRTTAVDRATRMAA